MVNIWSAAGPDSHAAGPKAHKKSGAPLPHKCYHVETFCVYFIFCPRRNSMIPSRTSVLQGWVSCVRNFNMGLNMGLNFNMGLFPNALS